MKELTRYNVRSKFVGGDVSWEFEAAADSQILFADSALTKIGELEQANDAKCEQIDALQKAWQNYRRGEEDLKAKIASLRGEVDALKARVRFKETVG